MTLHEKYFQSVQSGDVARVKALVASSPELIGARNESGLSAILLAMYHGHREVVALLLARHPELDIFEAAAVGEEERVKELLEKDPGLANATAPDGFSPLGLAAFFGHPKVAASLIEHGADANAPSKNSARVRPLHSALAHHRWEVSFKMAQRLIAGGADVNAKQAGGWAPLHQAAIHGQIDLAKLLLDRGADVHAKADNGKTPLDLAMAGKHKEMAALLRERGAVS
jgi:ankyrin repeat protein